MTIYVYDVLEKVKSKYILNEINILHGQANFACLCAYVKL